jgi:hypothetical protein
VKLKLGRIEDKGFQGAGLWAQLETGLRKVREVGTKATSTLAIALE